MLYYRKKFFNIWYCVVLSCVDWTQTLLWCSMVQEKLKRQCFIIEGIIFHVCSHRWPATQPASSKSSDIFSLSLTLSLFLWTCLNLQNKPKLKEYPILHFLFIFARDRGKWCILLKSTLLIFKVLISSNTLRSELNQAAGMRFLQRTWMIRLQRTSNCWIVSGCASKQHTNSFLQGEMGQIQSAWICQRRRGWEGGRRWTGWWNDWKHTVFIINLRPEDQQFTKAWK